MPVALRIALRYLLSRKSHSAVNVISLVSTAGVAVAVMAIVCVLSVFNGFSDMASEQMGVLTPDIRVAPAQGKTIDRADSITQAIRAIAGIAAAAPTLEERALAVTGGRQMPVRIKGVTEAYDTITGIADAVHSDGLFMLADPAGSPMATIAVGVALQLDARPGYDYEQRPLTIYVPRRRGRINPANPATAFREMPTGVAGVFEVDQAEFDTDLVIIPLSTAAWLLDYPVDSLGRTTHASAIELRLEPGANPSAVASRLAEILGPDYIVADRRQQGQATFRMISIEKWITFAMLAFILVIASFNIISTLSMLVIEKQHAMSTLRAMGAPASMIGRIFMLEGWLISLAGGIAGIVAGSLLCLAQQHWGFIRLGGDPTVMVTDIYPVRLVVSDLLAVLVLVAIIGWISSSLTYAFTRRRLSAVR